MIALQLFVRVILSVMFLVASLAKLIDHKGTKKAAIDFGSPARLASPIAIALPLAELAVGGLLIPVRSAGAGALGAFVLLVTFIVLIGINMVQGHKPDCHCFGQIHSEPIGWRTLARNGILAALAGFVMLTVRIGAAPSVMGWLGSLTPSLAIVAVVGIVFGFALAGEGWLLFNLARQNGRLLLRIEDLEIRLGAPAMSQKPTPGQVQKGLPIGAPAPSFELPRLSGGMLSFEMLRQVTLPVLLIFSDPNCSPCSSLLPEIAHWQEDYAGRINIAVISRGDAEANLAKATQHKVKNILLQLDREVAEQYQANGTPSAVLIHPDGTIGSRLVMGAEAIKDLVAHATGAALPVPSDGNGKLTVLRPHAGLPIGTPSPSINLPDLTGTTVTLEGLKGNKVLLLFWNPGCGYCQRLLPDIKAWEAHRRRDAPQLVLVSTGLVETNEAMGLKSRILLDAAFVVAQSFRASGTPSAVLLDGEGNIASELVVGGPGVLALAGMREVQPMDTRQSVAPVHAQAN